MFSLELPRNVMVIGLQALAYCYCLRNVAFPPNAVFNDTVLFDDEYHQRTDLYAEIISEMQHRFDGLPIHSLIYYQSYHDGVLQRLLAAINMSSGQRRTLRSKLDPTGNHQDCLGMTPLHILACSSVHDLELYRVIVEKYSMNLITEDRWGALPQLYAFWGAAPTEIIEFLLASYKSLYPGHAFNWTMMVETMGRFDTPKESIENLLWKDNSDILRSIQGKIASFEVELPQLKEATTILELALWKIMSKTDESSIRRQSYLWGRCCHWTRFAIFDNVRSLTIVEQRRNKIELIELSRNAQAGLVIK